MNVCTNFKVARLRSAKHMAFVGSLRCSVCPRANATQVHHLTCGPELKARGLKASDCWTVPLCHAHHDAQSMGSVHHAGDETAWWNSKERDPIEIAATLWAMSLEAGRA